MNENMAELFYDPVHLHISVNCMQNVISCL